MLNFLEGTENLSLSAESYVLVLNGTLRTNGKTIKATKRIVNELFNAELRNI